MSNVSIYEKNWIDLVFADKNKAYGAYQLRQENSRTTLFAFFGSILLLFSLFSVGILVNSITKSPIDLPVIPIDDPITPVNLSQLPETKPKQPQSTSHSSAPVEQVPNLSHMVVAATPQATANVPTNDNLPTNQNATPGTGVETPNDGREGPAVVTVPVVEKGPALPSELDRLPEYPGGIKKFYEYVGNNLDKPEINEDISAVSVIMSFVIEKDGAMTNIKVLRSTDKRLETEAIRVLKSLKVKWSPGYKDGEKMRTLYTLPIKVEL
jgi:protein TonB